MLCIALFVLFHFFWFLIELILYSCIVAVASADKTAVLNELYTSMFICFAWYVYLILFAQQLNRILIRIHTSRVNTIIIMLSNIHINGHRYSLLKFKILCFCSIDLNI